ACVDALAVCRGFVLVDAVFGTRKHRDRYRSAAGLQSTQAPFGFCTRRIVVVGGQYPQLWRVEIAQHRHGVVIRRDASQQEGAFFAKLGFGRFEHEERDVAMHVFEPRFLAVLRLDGGELIVTFPEIADDDCRRDIGYVHRLGNHVRAVTVAGQIEGDGLAILVEWRYRQAESDDHEIHGLDLRGQRGDPAALAATLVANATGTGPRETSGLVHRGNRIIGQQQVVLGVHPTRLAGATLVIHEYANAFGGKLSLQGIGVQRGRVLRAVHQHHDRHARGALRHHQPPGEPYASTLEGNVRDLQRDSLAGDSGEVDRVLVASERHALAVRALRPSQRAGPCAIRVPGQQARGAILLAPAHVIAINHGDIELAAVVQLIDAGR